MGRNQSISGFKILINTVFTAIVLISLLLLMFEARRYFLTRIAANKTTLNSGISNYKIKYEQDKQTAGYDISLSNNSASSVYETKPSIIVEKIDNILDIETNFSITNEPKNFEDPQDIQAKENEFARSILENPLLRRYYVQVGIFTEKILAKNRIKSLFDKLNMEAGAFHSYIETKTMHSKPFYIAQIGAFSTKQDALNFCARLQNISVKCLIVD